MVEIIDVEQEKAVDQWLTEGFDAALDEIEKQLEVEAAFAGLMVAVSSLNLIAQRWPGKTPRIIARLGGWIRRIKAAAKHLASSWPDVDSYSIGVNVPFGISVSIAFKP
jgi:hypothetical protein